MPQDDAWILRAVRPWGVSVPTGAFVACFLRISLCPSCASCHIKPACRNDLDTHGYGGTVQDSLRPGHHLSQNFSEPGDRLTYPPASGSGGAGVFLPSFTTDCNAGGAGAAGAAETDAVEHPRGVCRATWSPRSPADDVDDSGTGIRCSEHFANFNYCSWATFHGLSHEEKVKKLWQPPGSDTIAEEKGAEDKAAEDKSAEVHL